MQQRMKAPPGKNKIRFGFSSNNECTVVLWAVGHTRTLGNVETLHVSETLNARAKFLGWAKNHRLTRTSVTKAVARITTSSMSKFRYDLSNPRTCSTFRKLRSLVETMAASAYCVEDQAPVSTLYDAVSAWDEIENVNTMLHFVPQRTISFSTTSNLAASVRPSGYLHVLAKSLTAGEHEALSASLKTRLVYVFKLNDQLAICCFNSYDQQPDLQTERLIYSWQVSTAKPKVWFEEVDVCAYRYYAVGKVSVESSFLCFSKSSLVVCPKFLDKFQALVAQGEIYAVGTYGFANGGKRLCLRKNDGTFELIQLNVTADEKFYSYGDVQRFA